MTTHDYDPHDDEAGARFVERANALLNTPKRYALVSGARDAEEVARYLPDNYRVIHDTLLIDPDGRRVALNVIEGRDVAGWTLDAYVIPRLASGLIAAHEIDLSHPIMREVSS